MELRIGSKIALALDPKDNEQRIKDFVYAFADQNFTCMAIMCYRTKAVCLLVPSRRLKLLNDTTMQTQFGEMHSKQRGPSSSIVRKASSTAA